MKQNLLLLAAFFFTLLSAKSQNLTISGSNGHSVIICSNGAVFAWGLNNEGQIGLGSNDGGVTTFSYPAASYPTPQRVYGLSEIFQIDAGSGGHTLALTCDGRVNAWGRGDYGQLGQGVAATSAAPVFVLKGPEIAGLAGIGGAATDRLDGVSYVSGGNDESFAILETGHLAAWGQNDKGQLGNGLTAATQLTPVLVKTAAGTPITDVIMVEAGDENAYALTEDGLVYSWGDATDNGGAALGRPLANSAFARPVQKQGGGNLTNIVSISAGDRHVLAVDGDGNLWAWGGDWGHGQVGDGYNTGGYYTQLFATKVVAGEKATTPANWKTEFLGDRPETKVVSIAAGQAHSMAVLADGSVVTWGSNGFFNCGPECSAPAGQLGVGNRFTTMASYNTETGANTAPLIAQKCSGDAFTNASQVSDGDAWTFVLTEDGKIWVAGWNAGGQLGVGGTANSYCFTELSIPDCGILNPCPDPQLPENLEVCLGDSWTFDAGLIYPGYSAKWSINGDTVETDDNPLISGTPIEATFTLSNITAADIGNISVTIKDNRPATSRPCDPCPTVTSTSVLSFYTATFSDPGDLTYCEDVPLGTCAKGEALVNVTGLPTGEYEWYTTLTSTTLLGTSTASNTVCIPMAGVTPIGTEPNREWTVFVEDISSVEGTVRPISGSAGFGGEADGSPSSSATGTKRPDVIIFDALRDITVKSLDVRYKCGGTASLTVSVHTAAGVLVDSYTLVTPTCNNSYVTSTIPVDLQIPQGAGYRISLFGSTGVNIAWHENGPANWYPQTGTISGTDVIRLVSNDGYDQYYGEWSSPGYWNWVISTGSAYPCGRLPVVIKEDCPPCEAPTSLAITESDVTLCEGSDQLLNGTFTLGTAQVDGDYYISWMHESTVLSGPTVISAGVDSYNVTALTPAKSGWYYLRVEDGDEGNDACAAVDSIEITVDELVDPGAIEADQSICAGIDPEEITEQTAASGGDGTTYTYQWQSSLTGAAGTWGDIAGTAATFDPPVITSTTQYRRVVSSGVCPADTTAPVTITIKENPLVTDKSSNSPICEGEDLSIAFTTTGALGRTFSIEGPNSYSGTTEDVSITGATTAASGKYVLTVTDNGCTVKDSVEVVINPLPSPEIPIQTALCEGDSRGVSVTTPNATSSYAWIVTGTGASDNSSTTGTINVTAGTGDISLSVVETDANGCFNNPAETGSIPVDLAPSTAAVSKDTMSVCLNDAIELNGNSPTVGTGLWTVVSKSAAGITINSPTVHNSLVTGMAGGDQLVAEWTISNGVCPASKDTVTINATGVADPVATLSVDDDVVCEGTSVTFTAGGNNLGNAPTYVFKDNNTGTVLQTGSSDTYTTGALTADLSVIVEIESNSSCVSPGNEIDASDVVTVQVDAMPSTANAGADEEICTADYTLQGNTPTSGTGQWTLISGGGAFDDDALANTEVFNLNTGDNEYEWTISSGVCPPSSDKVVITRSGNLTVADAGANDTICISDGAVNLSGNAALQADEVIAWVSLDGPSLSSATTENTTATITAAGTYRFEYSINNNVCPVSRDTVVIQVDDQPAISPFSPDNVKICGSSYVLGAAPLTIATATGTWSILSGQGSLQDASNPTTTLEDLTVADITTLRWTVTNGVCPSVSEDFTVEKAGSVTTPEITLNGGGGEYSNEDVTEETNPLCLQKSYTISVNGPNTANGETGAWSIGTAGGTSVSQPVSDSQTLTLNSIGTTELVYTITSTIPGCAPEVRKTTFEVNDVPATPVSPTTPSGPLCQGTSSHTYSIPPVLGATSYRWSVGSGSGINITGDNTGTSVTVDLTATATDGVLEVVAINDCGESTELSIAVDVTEIVTPEVEIPSSLTICSYETLVVEPNFITNAGTNFGVQWYFWSSAISGPEGANKDSLVLSPTLTTGDQIYVEVYPDLPCPNPAVLNENGAVESNVLVLTVNDPPKVDIVVTPAKSICEGTSVEFSVEPRPGSDLGSPTYTWYVDEVAVTAVDEGSDKYTTSTLPAGNPEVKVVVTPHSTCARGTTSDSLNMEVIPNVTATAVITPTPDTEWCEGSNTIDISTFNVTGQHHGPSPTYEWFVDNIKVYTGPNYQPLPNLVSGNYDLKVVVTSDESCVINNLDTAHAFTNFVVNPKPQSEILSGGYFCPGRTLELEASPVDPTFSYEWLRDGVVVSASGPSATYQAGVAGYYSVRIITDKGCSQVSPSKQVQEFNITPQITSSTGIFTKCVSQTIRLSASPSDVSRIDWYKDNQFVGTGSFIDVGPSEGESGYKAVFVNTLSNDECKDSTDVYVDEEKDPAPRIVESDTTICRGEAINLTAVDDSSGISTFTWTHEGMEISYASTISVTESGIYSISASNPYCSTPGNSIRVTVDEVPVADAGADQYLIEGESSILSGLNSTYAHGYQWAVDTSTYAGQFEIDPMSPWHAYIQPKNPLNVFSLTVSSPSGKCTDVDTVIVKIEIPIKPWNSFSPNNDGTYDVWRIEFIENYPDALIEIYNRWGNLVWESKGYDNSGKAWRGENFRNDKNLPVATYYYIIYPNGDKVKEPMTGHVTIVK